MIEDLKSTVIEKPFICGIIAVVGVVIGFFASPWLRKVLKIKRF